MTVSRAVGLFSNSALQIVLPTAKVVLSIEFHIVVDFFIFIRDGM